MNSLFKTMLMLLLWEAGLYAVLNVRQVESLNVHAICGTWGCGPPLSALISWHGFWLLLVAPIVGLSVAWAKHLGANRLLLTSRLRSNRRPTRQTIVESIQIGVN